MGNLQSTMQSAQDEIVRGQNNLQNNLQLGQNSILYNQKVNQKDLQEGQTNLISGQQEILSKQNAAVDTLVTIHSWTKDVTRQIIMAKQAINQIVMPAAIAYGVATFVYDQYACVGRAEVVGQNVLNEVVKWSPTVATATGAMQKYIEALEQSVETRVRTAEKLGVVDEDLLDFSDKITADVAFVREHIKTHLEKPLKNIEDVGKAAHAHQGKYMENHWPAKWWQSSDHMTRMTNLQDSLRGEFQILQNGIGIITARATAEHMSIALENADLQVQFYNYVEQTLDDMSFQVEYLTDQQNQALTLIHDLNTNVGTLTETVVFMAGALEEGFKEIYSSLGHLSSDVREVGQEVQHLRNDVNLNQHELLTQLKEQHKETIQLLVEGESAKLIIELTKTVESLNAKLSSREGYIAILEDFKEGLDDQLFWKRTAETKTYWASQIQIYIYLLVLTAIGYYFGPAYVFRWELCLLAGSTIFHLTLRSLLEASLDKIFATFYSIYYSIF